MLNKKDRVKEIKNIYTPDPKFESAVDIMAEIFLKVIERQKNKKEQEEYRKERQEEADQSDVSKTFPSHGKNTPRTGLLEDINI